MRIKLLDSIFLIAILGSCTPLPTFGFNTPLVTPQPSTTPMPQATSTPLIAVALNSYNEVYRQNDWCALWNVLKDDNLIDGTCPTLGSLIKSNLYMDRNENLLFMGGEIRASSNVQVIFPACAIFSELSATADTNKVSKWVNNNYIGTNVTMKKGSSFKLFFRCDDIMVP